MEPDGVKFGFALRMGGRDNSDALTRPYCSPESGQLSEPGRRRLTYVGSESRRRRANLKAFGSLGRQWQPGRATAKAAIHPG